MTSFVPGVLASTNDARSGDPALKNGPSVSCGVNDADVLPLLHACASEPAGAATAADVVAPAAACVLPVTGMGWLDVAIGATAAGVPAAQPASATAQSITAILRIILFITHSIARDGSESIVRT